MTKTAVVTGAGSGVGRATAIALAQEGWRVAVVGRRRETLEQTIKVAGRLKHPMLLAPCDVGKADEVGRVAEVVFKAFGHVDVLVNAAGTNAPCRALEVLSPADYHLMIDTNLNGAYCCPGSGAGSCSACQEIDSFAPSAEPAKAGSFFRAAPHRRVRGTGRGHRSTKNFLARITVYVESRRCQLVYHVRELPDALNA